MANAFKVLIITFGVISTASAQSQCPRIVPKAGWSTRRDTRFVPLLPVRPANFVIMHAAGKDQLIPCSTQADCATKFRSIQDFHMTVNGWPDISYHFMLKVLPEDGNIIFAGRGWNRIGENVGDFTNQAISIGVMARLQFGIVSDSGTELLNGLIECGISEGHLSPDVRVVAQCQVSNFIGCEPRMLEWISQNPRWISDPQPL